MHGVGKTVYVYDYGLKRYQLKQSSVDTVPAFELANHALRLFATHCELKLVTSPSVKNVVGSAQEKTKHDCII